jgi:hypothetical protein
MNRRSFLKTVAAGAAALAGIGTKAAAGLPKPNLNGDIFLREAVTVPTTSTIGPYGWCDFPSFDAWQEALSDAVPGRLDKTYRAEFVSREPDKTPIRIIDPRLAGIQLRGTRSP